MGLGSWPLSGPYTVSKHGVVALSETLRTELAQRAPGVGVTVLCPSYVPTRIGDAARNRPPSLTPTDQAAVPPREIRGHTPVAPRTVGDQVVDAIERGRFYLPTHPGQDAVVRQRFEVMLADLS